MERKKGRKTKVRSEAKGGREEEWCWRTWLWSYWVNGGKRHVGPCTAAAPNTFHQISSAGVRAQRLSQGTESLPPQQARTVGNSHFLDNCHFSAKRKTRLAKLQVPDLEVGGKHARCPQCALVGVKKLMPWPVVCMICAFSGVHTSLLCHKLITGSQMRRL